MTATVARSEVGKMIDIKYVIVLIIGILCIILSFLSGYFFNRITKNIQQFLKREYDDKKDTQNFIEDKKLINARELIDDLKKGKNVVGKNNKQLLKGLKMIAKEPDWENKIDSATLEILSNLNIKRKLIEKNKIVSGDNTVKIDKKHSHIRNEEDSEVEYVTESYWYNPEDGSFDINENQNIEEED